MPITARVQLVALVSDVAGDDDSKNAVCIGHLSRAPQTTIDCIHIDQKLIQFHI